ARPLPRHQRPRRVRRDRRPVAADRPRRPARPHSQERPMTLKTVTVYADDADAYVDRIVTDAAGTDLTFEPAVAVGAGDFDITATWLGDAAPSRTLRIPVAGLEVGTHRLYLSVPGGNDLDLGGVNITARR